MTSVQGTPDPGKELKKRETRDIVRIVAAVVILVLLIAFVLKNSQTVRVHFIFFSANVALIWVLLIAAVLGAAVDRLIILLGQRRKKVRRPGP